MDIQPKYLVMISGDSNHNKYYKMSPHGDTFTVEYGRVGGGSQSRSYSIHLFERKYSEKIAKGYVDRTDLVKELIERGDDKTPDGYKRIENEAIAEIVSRLQEMAGQAIAENYTITSDKVTMQMVTTAQNVLTSLVGCFDVESFNKTLIELYGVIPRKMTHVKDHMAKEISDFGKIIEREQDLLDVMRGQVYIPAKAVLDDLHPESEETILEAKGLEFYEATAEDVKKIKACLGSCADKFHRAWCVTNVFTQKKFDDYVNDGKVATKLLWHGSRNENWWSIIGSGLVLRPTSAVITGKMFGYGTYFATKARKSLGYTSLNGSYWAKGSSQSAFMGLYAVAYGKPYDVYAFDSRFYSFNYDALQKACPGANCLHAHEGTMLKNDEIVVYKECQTAIKYLVELRQR